MNGNNFMSWVLRSPFQGLISKGMMLITVKGRKTGKQYTTPVGYYRIDDTLWILTNRDRTWWRNLKGVAEVRLWLNGKPIHACAEPQLDEKTVETRLYEYLRHIPQAVRPLGIRIENGSVNADDIRRVSKSRLFVKVQLNT